MLTYYYYCYYYYYYCGPGDKWQGNGLDGLDSIPGGEGVVISCTYFLSKLTLGPTPPPKGEVGRA